MISKNNQLKYAPINNKRIFSTCFFILLIFILTGCKRIVDIIDLGQTYHEGYVISPKVFSFISIGSSKDHVLLTLGTPSTYDNGTFYYISQTRYRGSRFMKPRIISRRVVVIYFDNNKKVSKIANYGLKDGKIFDYISRTTKEDSSFLREIFKRIQPASFFSFSS